MFPNNTHKAITFSFDDRVTQDRRLVALFNKYNLKCTFNLNSGGFGKDGVCHWQKWSAPHNKVNSAEVKALYSGHEVAVHTVNHPDLTTIADEKIIIDEIEQDRKVLEKLTGDKIVGMAYPFGTLNDRIVNIIKRNTPIKYARSIWATYNFDLQDNLLAFRPTIHFLDFKKMYELAGTFLNTEYNEDKIFYIWGHSYELDFEDTWEEFEKFLAYIANKKDVFYGTNKEVLLNGQK